MKMLRLVLLALACTAPLAATAQWQWLDKDGRKVFSDRPPPPDVAPNRVLKQPGGRVVIATEAPVAEPVKAEAEAPKVPAKDKDLEAKKKLAESAAADQKKARQEAQARAMEDNCRRARAGKANLETGGRIGRVNEKGEREIMDDSQIAAEGKRLDQLIARECKS